jgi:hypothetical protein
MNGAIIGIYSQSAAVKTAQTIFTEGVTLKLGRMFTFLGSWGMKSNPV